MSNIAKVETVLSQVNSIEDHLGQPQFTGRLMSALAWSAGAKIINAHEWLAKFQVTLDKIAERYEGDEDKIREMSENTVSAMEETNNRLEEAKKCFAYFSEFSFKGGADVDKIMEIIAKPQDEVRAEQVVDLDAIDEAVAAGEITPEQAEKEKTEAILEQMEINQRMKDWYNDQQDYLRMELKNAQDTHPGEFELSDEMYRSIIEKISDKIDSFIDANGALSRRLNKSRRVRTQAISNKPLLNELQRVVDSMVRSVNRELNGAGYKPTQGTH